MKNRGLTLVEFLVAIAILTIISGILVAIFISGWRIFNQESSSSETRTQAKLITSFITEEIKKANSVIKSRAFGDSEYTSSSNTLILELPAIDNNHNIIPGSFDYEVFYLDTLNPRKLKLITEAAPDSIRTSGTRTLSTLIENIEFIYKKRNAETEANEADIITIKITTSKISFGKTQKTSLVAQAKLRNK